VICLCVVKRIDSTDSIDDDFFIRKDFAQRRSEMPRMRHKSVAKKVVMRKNTLHRIDEPDGGKVPDDIRPGILRLPVSSSTLYLDI